MLGERVSKLSLASLLALFPANLEMNKARRFLVRPFSFFLSFSPSSAIELVRDHREAVAGGGDNILVLEVCV
jgi:hypothetical protein